jgi:hypothetical protein
LIVNVKNNFLIVQDAKQRREDLGVEMYGFQQQLAWVQKSLKEAQKATLELAGTRLSAEQHVSQLHTAVGEESRLLQKERDTVRCWQSTSAGQNLPEHLR